MKITYLLIAVSVLLITVKISNAQNTYIPDDNFEQFLINNGYDTGELNDSVPTDAIKNIISLDIRSKGIVDITGIEDFNMLETLECSWNRIESINLRSNTQLKFLYCMLNFIDTIDLSNNINLVKFDCRNNKLTSLDLGNNTNLTSLFCSNNKLTGLDLGNNTNLTMLYCDFNNLTNLDVSNNTKLEYLGCEGNKIENINVSNTNLIKINCNQNNIFSLDVSTISGLQELYCLENKIVALDVSQNILLRELHCGDNKIESIDIRNNIELERFDCSHNRLTSLDLNNNAKLYDLYCSNNSIIDLDVHTCPVLMSLYCSNNQLTGLNLKNGNIPYLHSQNNPYLYCIEVDDVDVANSRFCRKDSWSVFKEDCSNYVVNNMTYVPDDNFEQALIHLGLDPSGLNDSVPTCSIENLKSLDISNKNILDLTGIQDFVSLEILKCNNNQLNTLDISRNTNLQELNCGENNIAELDIEANSKLEILFCYNNKLTGLNLRNGNNSNMNLSALGNSDLFCIQVDDSIAAYSYNWEKENYAEYRENCSGYMPKKTYVPGDNFEQALIDMGFDKTLDDSVYTEAISHIKSLNIASRHISDLTGIEDFKELTNLNCFYNNLTYVNFNSNKNIKSINCYANKFQSLNLDSAIYLEYLDCNCNLLDTLNFKNNVNLQTLICYNNKLTSLNVESNSLLSRLNCKENYILDIDLHNNVNLTELYVSNNKLVNLDLSNNYLLSRLSCNNNQLANLDIKNGNNENLRLNARNNYYLCIQVDDTIAAKTNSFWYKDVWAYYSEDCSTYSDRKTYVPDDNFEQALIDQGYDFGRLDDSVSTAVIRTITALEVQEKNISDLTGIQDFKSLGIIWCYKNQLKKLDFSSNRELVTINCWKNQLTELITDSLSNLGSISCGMNNLSELNLSSNYNLYGLECSNNNLSELNLNSNNFSNLRCSNNNITNLDLSAYPNLYYLEANNNNLISVNLKNGNNAAMMVYIQDNPNLFCIQVDDAYAASHYNWTKDPQADYSEDCNYFMHQTYVPDDNFEQALIDLGYDEGELNDSVPFRNICDEISVSVPNKNIFDLTGIEDFISLRNFICSGNYIEELNIGNIPDLYYLDCSNNNLKQLDLSGNLELRHVDCYNNEITSLDLSLNKELELINCARNKLTSLNVRNGNNQNMTGVPLSVYGMYATGNPYLSCIQVDNPEAISTSSNWAKDETAFYSENCGMTGTGIPLAEYNSLVDIFYSTSGENWINNSNWLDTINSSVSNWYGVTVKNGHVTKLLLSYNNLHDSIFNNPVNLPEIRRIELSNNLINSLNFLNIGSLGKLDTLIIDYNNLVFREIEPVFSLSNYSRFKSSFFYSPQNIIGKPEYIEVQEGSSLVLNVQNSYLSENDKFQWYKNGHIIHGQTDSILYFANIEMSDSSIYHLEITNPNVPDFILRTYNKSVSVVPFNQSNVPVSEYNALVDFYNNLNGNNWTRNDNWLDTINHNVSDWYGITVENGHVTEIEFDAINRYGLEGSIPNSIKDLKELEKLFIISEDVSGQIPDGLYELVNLKSIIIVECNLSGNLSRKIGNLINLEVLALEANRLEGSLPKEIGSLTRLKRLTLYENKFSGNIPGEICKLSNLELLNFSHNNIIGLIPSSIGDLTNLEYLLLDNNSLSGGIPKTIGNLSKLKRLFLNDNKLKGPLPVELANLKNVLKIDIGNNLIGSKNGAEKSAIAYERQIPDELAQLIALDTINIDNNMLMFNDIEPVFSWDNYNNLQEFIYYPQDLIGIEKEIYKNETENVTLTIDNYYPGNSDRYRWFKNNKLIQGEIGLSLSLTNLKSTDVGIYYCEITNPVVSHLKLKSQPILLNVSKAKGAGVPISEYLSLVEIYNKTNGAEWINNQNWLDTIYNSVNDWFGITVSNGHVVGFEMPNNNLTCLPTQLKKLTEIKEIDLSFGNFSDSIPNFENLNHLEKFSVSGNGFTFNKLTPVTRWLNYNNFKDNFVYSPQSCRAISDTTFYQFGDTISLIVENYNIDTSDSFEWFKNSQSLQNVKHTKELNKKAWFDDNNAVFNCQITNDLFPDLVFVSGNHTTMVKYSSNDSTRLTNLRKEYNVLQNIWIGDSVFHWPFVTADIGIVTSLDLSGLNLDGPLSSQFAHFDSLTSLNLSNNNLKGVIPEMGLKKGTIKNANKPNLKYLNIANNNFVFADFEPASDNLNSIDSFIYSPQNSVGESFDTTIYKYQNVTFKIKNFTSGNYDVYSWAKNGVPVDNNNSVEFTIENAALADSGYYFCLISSTLFPKLTITTDTNRLKVLIPVGINDFPQNEITVYPNPASEKIYVDSQNEKVNIEIYNIVGKLVLRKNNFSSGWIDISECPDGIYLFKFIKGNSKQVTRKIVFN